MGDETQRDGQADVHAAATHGTDEYVVSCDSCGADITVTAGELHVGVDLLYCNDCNPRT